MADHYGLLRRVQMAGRLLTDGKIDPETLGQGGRDFVLTRTQEVSSAALGAALAEGSDTIAALITVALTAPAP